jgi:hypothetical protein
MYQQVVNIGWAEKPVNHTLNPIDWYNQDPEKLAHAMFFVKALPLGSDMNVSLFC